MGEMQYLSPGKYLEYIRSSKRATRKTSNPTGKLSKRQDEAISR